jgi:hypothetical protein
VNLDALLLFHFFALLSQNLDKTWLIYTRAPNVDYAACCFPDALQPASSTERSLLTWRGPVQGLETEDLVLELADGPGLGETKTLGRLLHGCNHRRGAADEDLHVAGGRRKLLLDHIGRDEANTPSPTLRGVVENVMYTELGVTGGKRVKIGLEQDVVGVYVREDEVDLGLVAGGAAAVDGLDNLQHGSDASAACNHAEVPDHIGCIDHGALGALNLHLVADLEVRNVLGDVTGGVRLDQEIEETLVVVGGGGGVRAHNLLGLTFDTGGEGNVLADGKTENVALLGELEAVATNINISRC